MNKERYDKYLEEKLERTFTCPVCRDEVPPDEDANFHLYDTSDYQGCCSKECARMLVLLRGLASISVNLATLVAATRPSEYDAFGLKTDDLVEGWCSPSRVNE